MCALFETLGPCPNAVNGSDTGAGVGHGGAVADISDGAGVGHGGGAADISDGAGVGHGLVLGLKV